MSYIKLCHVYVKFKRINQSCFSSKISQSMLNGALVIEMVNNFFSESMEKKRVMGSEKYILLDFAKYLSFSEVQKNSKVVNVYIRFQEDVSLF